MRTANREPSVFEKLKRSLRGWRGCVATVGAVVCVASSGLWLFRDVSSLVKRNGPDEASLIVNINEASLEELETIPGIGPARAAQIVAERPYGTVDELEKIPGIGPAQVDSMRPFVTVSSSTSSVPAR